MSDPSSIEAMHVRHNPFDDPAPKRRPGTIIALMIPYVAIITIVWIALFVLWFVLGLPLGPGYPVAA